MSSKTRIRAGDLRHRIQLVQPTLVQDKSGGVEEDQATIFATVWAQIEALTGRELYAAQQRVSQVSHQITLRYMPGITATLNVRFNNREFQILSVENPDERTKMLILLCLERDSSAREQGGSAI
jgi:SPP1 family predicted phage head-tail adaptor